MTIREQFEHAMGEWQAAVDQLNGAITDFTDDGMQTRGGTWILTMSQVKSDALWAARHRADRAKAELDRIIDELQLPQGARRSN